MKKDVTVKVLQLDTDKEETREIAFFGSDCQMKTYGKIRMDLYRTVYEGPVNVSTGKEVSETLECIYEALNIDKRPEGYSGWSLSPSDIVEVEGTMYYVEPVGFTELKKETAS